MKGEASLVHGYLFAGKSKGSLFRRPACNIAFIFRLKADSLLQAFPAINIAILSLVYKLICERG
jgi:hypothetical protein